MHLFKKILIAIFVVFFLCIGALYHFIQSLPDLCGNAVLAEYPSPNGRLKAVVFERDCGATTDFSTQISILPSAYTLENEGGNIYAADTNHGAAPAGQGGGPEVWVNWLSDAELQVRYHKFVRINHTKIKIEGVTVKFVSF